MPLGIISISETESIRTKEEAKEREAVKWNREKYLNI